MATVFSKYSPLSVLLRLLAVFFVAAVNAITLGAVINVEAWKAAVMAGSFSVLEILRSLAMAYRDGTLTKEEVESSFGGNG